MGILDDLRGDKDEDEKQTEKSREKEEQKREKQEREQADKATESEQGVDSADEGLDPEDVKADEYPTATGDISTDYEKIDEGLEEIESNVNKAVENDDSVLAAKVFFSGIMNYAGFRSDVVDRAIEEGMSKEEALEKVSNVCYEKQSQVFESIVQKMTEDGVENG